MIQKVERILDEQVRPFLRGHGGAVRLLSIEDGVVRIELLGACSGCPSADMGTRAMIEEALKTEIPEVIRVEVIHEMAPDILEMAKKILSHGEPL